MQDQHCSCITAYAYINVHLTSLIRRGTRPSFMCFLTYTVQDARTLGLYISMDSLTLTLASFSQRYLAEAQDNINVLEQMKIVT